MEKLKAQIDYYNKYQSKLDTYNLSDYDKWKEFNPIPYMHNLRKINFTGKNSYLNETPKTTSGFIVFNEKILFIKYDDDKTYSLKSPEKIKRLFFLRVEPKDKSYIKYVNCSFAGEYVLIYNNSTIKHIIGLSGPFGYVITDGELFAKK